MTEQKKGAYKYFVDLGDRLENVVSRTSYVDEVPLSLSSPLLQRTNNSSLLTSQLTEQEHLRQRFVFGPEGGGEGQPGFLPSSSLSDDGEDLGFGARTHSRGARKHYKAHEVATFKSLGEEPGIKLLGFKGREELAFEDNVRHATFLVPDEAVRFVLLSVFCRRGAFRRCWLCLIAGADCVFPLVLTVSFRWC